MNVTFSAVAEAILSRKRDFRDSLLKAIAPLPGGCFIDGKVGRIAANDEIVLMCQGHSPITLTFDELKYESTVTNIIEKWSKVEED